MREGSNPNFCPPVEEGMTLTFQDEKGDTVDLEFLGMLLHEGHSYGFFFEVSEDTPACSSGEVILLEATEYDEEGEPASWESVDDEAIAQDAYIAFQKATKDLYEFAES